MEYCAVSVLSPPQGLARSLFNLVRLLLLSYLLFLIPKTFFDQPHIFSFSSFQFVIWATHWRVLDECPTKSHREKFSIPAEGSVGVRPAFPRSFWSNALMPAPYFLKEIPLAFYLS